MRTLAIVKNTPRPWDKWVLSDFELLGTPFERHRADITGQPQTVNLACTQYGIVLASSDYIRLVKELNPGMTDVTMVGMMDAWTPAGAKWRDGDKKVPAEIIFASNPISTLDLIPNPGGLTGIPGGAMVYQIDTMNYDNLFMYTAETLPLKYIMHFTVNQNGRDIVNPIGTLGGRYGIPVKLPIISKSPMYIRRELLDEIGSRNNRYSPPWDKGQF